MIKRYKVQAVGTVHLYRWFRATSEDDARRQAGDLPPDDWHQEWCGAVVDVEVGDVVKAVELKEPSEQGGRDGE